MLFVMRKIGHEETLFTKKFTHVAFATCSRFEANRGCDEAAKYAKKLDGVLTVLVGKQLISKFPEDAHPKGAKLAHFYFFIGFNL